MGLDQNQLWERRGRRDIFRFSLVNFFVHCSQHSFCTLESQKTVSVSVQAKLDLTFPTADMEEDMGEKAKSYYLLLRLMPTNEEIRFTALSTCNLTMMLLSWFTLFPLPPALSHPSCCSLLIQLIQTVPPE